ncbi:DLA class I histocompatibility antigen, A9/A9 alpha chain-like isoform X3 [Brachyhypopomus gauderio]
MVMVDDVQLFYFDSDENEIQTRDYIPVQEHIKNIKLIFDHQYRSMKYRAMYSAKQLNNTHGVHVLQRLAGCELFDHDSPGPMRSWDAFEGVNEENLYFNTQLNTLQSEGKWPSTWGMTDRNDVELMYTHIYKPLCFEILKSVLQMKRNHNMRQEKPIVRLFQKAATDSGGVLLTCLATGFYPRHLNLTLIRDGQPVPEEDLMGGEVVPNADGTYQMRKIMKVSAEEMREKHIYTCTATHLSLDNKINISMEISPPADSMSTMSVVFVVLGLVVVCGIFIAVYLKHRR